MFQNFGVGCGLQDGCVLLEEGVVCIGVVSGEDSLCSVVGSDQVIYSGEVIGIVERFGVALDVFGTFCHGR